MAHTWDFVANYDWRPPMKWTVLYFDLAKKLKERESIWGHSLFNTLQIFLGASLKYHMSKACLSLHMAISSFDASWPVESPPNDPVCWRFSRRSWPYCLKYWALLFHFLARPTPSRWQWAKHHCVNFAARREYGPSA